MVKMIDGYMFYVMLINVIGMYDVLMIIVIYVYDGNLFFNLLLIMFDFGSYIILGIIEIYVFILDKIFVV